jgi:hypothetical protein
MQCNVMQCDGIGWLVGWLELVLGWENAEAEAKETSTNRLTALLLMEMRHVLAAATSAWWTGGVLFFAQGKFAEHGTEVCTTLGMLATVWPTNSVYRIVVSCFCLLGLMLSLHPEFSDARAGKRWRRSGLFKY